MNEIARSDLDTGAESTATNTDTEGRTDVETNAREESGTADRLADESAGSPREESSGRSGDQSSGRSGDQTTGQSRLPLDETFELLRNQRRRHVLQYLAEKGGEASLSELAEQIAAWENGKDVRQITSSERKRVYVGLYQCHLPKMDGMGVIAFDKAKGSVRRLARADALEPYLRRTGVPDRASRTGPGVGPSVAASTLLPVAILAVSQSMISVGLAAFVVSAATLWGIARLWGARSDDQTIPMEHTAA